jgi:hypothetical protein
MRAERCILPLVTKHCLNYCSYKIIKINRSIKQITNPEIPIFSSNALTYFKNQRIIRSKAKLSITNIIRLVQYHCLETIEIVIATEKLEILQKITVVKLKNSFYKF